MFNLVNNSLFKQIKRIKEESQELMTKVIGHRKKVTNEVEACYNNLMSKRNELQKVQITLNHLIENSHVTEKVKQRKRIMDEVSEIKPGEFTISKPQALSQACKWSITFYFWYISFNCSYNCKHTTIKNNPFSLLPVYLLRVY